MTSLVQLITWLRNLWCQQATPTPPPPDIPERADLFRRLESLRQQQASASAMRSANIATLTQELRAARTRIDDIQTALTVQHRVAWQEGLEASNALERVTAALIENAPLSLGIFINEMDRELAYLRQLEPTIVPCGADRNYALMKKTVRYQSNAASISRRTTAVFAARSRAMALQSEDLSVRDLTSELYKIRRELPEIVDEEARGSHAAMVLG